MTMESIDINCDMGESFGNWTIGEDEIVVRQITTANVACGFHAGDPVTLMRTADLIRDAGIVAGCHPGLPDLLGFGRRAMNVSADDLYAYVAYQVGAARAVLGARGIELHHVKPHGAMFASTSASAELADAVVSAIIDTCPEPVLYTPTSIAGDTMPTIARDRGVKVVSEFYPDLSYTDDGYPRTERNKHHVDPERVVNVVRQFLDRGTVTTKTGNEIPIEADSFCLHGDSPNAGEIAIVVKKTVEELGIAMRPATAFEPPSGASENKP
jgi:UPF0271 protein